jgi:prephenate dehydrogenase
MGTQITIIGMNVTGASIGMALGAYKEEIIRMGVDRNKDFLKKAEKSGAVDKTSMNVPSAIKGSDIIILAEPQDQLLETLDIICGDLNPSVHLFDVSGIKQAINLHLGKVAPDYHNHINCSLVVNPDFLLGMAASLDDARADQFKAGLMVIGIPEGTSKETVELVGKFAGLLEMRLMFSEPVEMDGFQSAVNYLPQILASTLINVAGSQAGWRDAQKLVNAPFMIPAGTIQMLPDAASASSEWLADKDNLIRYIDLVTQELLELRSELKSDEPQQLSERVTFAKETYSNLLKQRMRGDLSDNGQEKIHFPSSGEALRDLFIFGKKK